MSDVQYAVDDRVARITLNRPERGNGINRALLTGLEQAVERADLDPDVSVLLLSGNGKGFCGGYDLVQSAEGQGRLEDDDVGMGGGASAGVGGTGSPPGSPLDPEVMRANHDPAGVWDPTVDYAMMSRNVRAFMSLFDCGKPVVCKVHGFCVAGGTDLALCADLLVIAADAKIGYPPARVWGSPTTSMWAYRLGPAARQAPALHRRLAVGRRSARVGLGHRGARGIAALTSAPRPWWRGSHGCPSISCG